MATLNFDLAVKLWEERYARTTAWECPAEVERVAAMSGLGVLSIEARDFAVNTIRADYYDGRRFNKARYDALDISECSRRWAQCLQAAVDKFPATTVFPILAPEGHRVGEGSCFGPARKGKWTANCFRAAWGNAQPFGLAVAEKPCSGCRKEMRFWCWGRSGEAEFRWSIDHIEAHAGGGCVCYFNLRAICPNCNSAKGSRRR